MAGLKYKIGYKSVKSAWLTVLLAVSIFGLMPIQTYAIIPVSPGPIGSAGVGSTSQGSGSQGSDSSCSGGMIKSGGVCKCPQGTELNKDNNCQDSAITCDKGNCDLIKKYLTPGITLFSALFGIIAVISLILGGIQYSSSSGDPQKVAHAKSRIINTVIAVVCYLFVYSFLQFLVPGGLFNK